MTTQPTPMHFPIDECAKCTVRGDMGGCLATRCSLHESWYARTQHARITELESQLAQRFDAADMATAAAYGFLDGVASVSPGSEPVAWQYRSVRDKGLWFDCTEERAKQRAAHPDKWDVRYLYTHPYPKEGMAGWQPIETAPKDGQAILVTDGMDCYCVEWDEEFDWWTVDDNKLGPFRLRGSAPTHWMPLPAAPGPAEGESNELC